MSDLLVQNVATRSRRRASPIGLLVVVFAPSTIVYALWPGAFVIAAASIATLAALIGVAICARRAAR